jgi:hypothetical protein
MVSSSCSSSSSSTSSTTNIPDLVSSSTSNNTSSGKNKKTTRTKNNNKSTVASTALVMTHQSPPPCCCSVPPDEEEVSRTSASSLPSPPTRRTATSTSSSDAAGGSDAAKVSNTTSTTSTTTNTQGKERAACRTIPESPPVAAGDDGDITNVPSSSSPGTFTTSRTNHRPNAGAAAVTAGKVPLGKRIRKLFQRSSSSMMSFSSSSRHFGGMSNTTITASHTNSTDYYYNNNNNNRNRRRRRFQRKNSFSSITETSIKSLGTIDLNHSNSLLDDGDEEGLGLYAYDDIEKFHNCGGGGSSCLSLFLLASSSSSLLSLKSLSSSCDHGGDDDYAAAATDDDDDVTHSAKEEDADHDGGVKRRCDDCASMQTTNDGAHSATRRMADQRQSFEKQQQQQQSFLCSEHPSAGECTSSCSVGNCQIDSTRTKQSLLDEHVGVVMGNDPTTINSISIKKKSLLHDDDKQEEQQQSIDCHATNNNNSRYFLSTTSTKNHHVISSTLLLSFEKEQSIYHQLSELHQEGKKLLEAGEYDRAWNVQSQALAFISSFRTTSSTNPLWNIVTNTSTHDHSNSNNKNNNNKKNECWQAELASFCARQEASIRYELAKIKYLHAREETAITATAATTTAHHHYHDDDDAKYQMHLVRLYDLVENARCKVALCNYEYYTSQLRAVEESKDASDMNQIYNKLYILHNLGSLCEKDLHRYNEALVFYQHALDIEERVLRAYRAHHVHEKAAEVEQQQGGRGWTAHDTNRCPSHDEEETATAAVEIDFHIDDFVQRIRCTKRKIGRIQHTGMGRFDLALLSSIST